MSRSKTIRKANKDRVREELSQTDDNRRRHREDMMDIFMKDKSNGTVPGSLRYFIGKFYMIFILFPYLVFLSLDLKRDAVEEKVDAIFEGKVPPNVTYEDSDQSPVDGLEAILLKIELGTGLDYDPCDGPHLSDWLKTLFNGDYEKFLSFLRGISEDEVRVLLSKRESLLNIPAVFRFSRHFWCSTFLF